MKRNGASAMGPGRLLWVMLAVAAFVSMIAGQARAAPPAEMLQTIQPRAFGHVIGDVVEQRALLEGSEGAFVPKTLPRTQRQGMWVERTESRIEADPQGRRWLVMKYQIINAPKEIRRVELPAVRLSDANAAKWYELSPASITIAPLLLGAKRENDELRAILRPEHLPVVDDGGERGRRALRWAIAALLTGALWLGWWLWRNHREASSLPFSRAARVVAQKGAQSTDSWQAMHHAFDRTAERVVGRGSIDALIAKAPWLNGARAQIAAFYEESGRRFFAPQVQSPQAPTQAPTQGMDLGALSRQLRALERGRPQR